jgi:glyoxylase-like metal-dependent hydrolase (beta-lactamase superfamily II)
MLNLRRHEWAIGALRIHPIEELCEPVFPLELFLSGLPDDAIDRNIDWLMPDFIDPETRKAIMSDHAWLVRTPHHNVLIDTCWGNHKPRPDYGGHLNTPWLARLAAIGLAPADIDFVTCTHLHADHVGWNTQLIDGRWVPTFPKARYLIGRCEYDYWSQATNRAYGHDAAFQDSVLPCMEAGLVTLVEGGYAFDDALTLQDAPGHTEGNMVVRATSGGATGIFCGDVVHLPIQLKYPEVNSIACDLPQLARKTRRLLLNECAEAGHLLCPGHFPAPYVGRVSRAGEAYRFLPGAGAIQWSKPDA